MATNQYFNKFNKRSEQNLVDDLIIESIQIHGHDFVYLPRTKQKEDLIYGEDVLSKFDDTHDIEMYIKSTDGFQGQGDMLTKFGIEIKDQATLWVSKSRWQNVANAGSDTLIRPREGDLLFYPFNNALFEIKFVANETIHYQLGELYVYELTIEQFVYSDETLKTGIDEIDDVEKEQAYTLSLGIGAGTGTYQIDESVYQGASFATATAKAIVSDVDHPVGTIKIRNIIGDLDIAAGNLIGVASLATHVITTLNELNNVNDQLDDTVRLETEADQVIDFTETDPFSEGNEY